MQRLLLHWFREFGRDLPWRRTHRPYEVWISEMMLQQTQVKTMLPYYHRWMERFPDVPSLASSSEEEVLRLWAGLGYYSRAVNLRKAARIMVREHGGRLPRDHQALLRLPGIGRYSAGAIMSIAFNEDFPVVDGNVERILARIFDVAIPVKQGEGLKAIWEVAERLLPGGDGRRFNQALMDLGAGVCLARKPLCEVCPVKGLCRALRGGVAGERPVSAARKPAIPIDVAIGVLVHEGKVLIQKRPPVGLMANLWEFPGGRVTNGEAPEEAVVREFLEELNVGVRCHSKIALIRHSYTSFRVALHAFWCRLQGDGGKMTLNGAVEARWVEVEELSDYPFPAANRKLISMLRTGAGDPSRSRTTIR